MANLVEIQVIFPNAESIKGSYADVYSPYSLSRYKRKEILYSDDFFYATMYPEDMAIPESTIIKYVVKAFDKNRLDLIAKRFYGNASLFWVIAYYNDLLDPFNVPVGTILEIPSKTSLYVSGGVLS